MYIGYIAVFFGVNELVCWRFNRGIPHSGLKSSEDGFTRTWPRHDDEAWIFLNGICVGCVDLSQPLDSTECGQQELVPEEHRPDLTNISSAGSWYSQTNVSPRTTLQIVILLIFVVPASSSTSSKALSNAPSSMQPKTYVNATSSLRTPFSMTTRRK